MTIIVGNINNYSTSFNNFKDNPYISLSQKMPDKIFLYGLKNTINCFQAAISTVNNVSKHINSLIVEFDLNILIKLFNNSKKGKYMSFAIINCDMEIIAQSKPKFDERIETIKNLLKNTKALYLIKQHYYEKQKFNIDSKLELYDVNILKNKNYYITKIPYHPFILILHINPNILKQKLFNHIVAMLIDTFMMCICFIIVIIAIYKRENWLRFQAEQAYQVAKHATQAKSEFLSFTAHEIRSQLGFIITGSEIMKKNLLAIIPEVYNHYINGIHKNAKLILDFIDDILDEARIVTGSFKITYSVVNILNIIDDVEKINLIRFNNRKITINKEYISNPLPMVHCDSTRMLQIINNLISNAIKYSLDDTTIILKVKLTIKGMEISIIDQGIGMSAEEIAAALKIYGTTHKNQVKLAESHGLGLKIVKILLDAHKAELNITSKKNIGTTVTILLPNHMLLFDS